MYIYIESITADFKSLQPGWFEVVYVVRTGRAGAKTGRFSDADDYKTQMSLREQRLCEQP